MITRIFARYAAAAVTLAAAAAFADTAAPAPSLPGGNMQTTNAPASAAPANDNGGLRIVAGDKDSAAANRTHIEGQLIDIYSYTHGDLSHLSPTPITGSMSSAPAQPGGSAAAAGLKPNNIDNNTGTGAINGKGTGMSGNTGTLVPAQTTNTTGNSSGNSVAVAPGGSGNSFGTYDHPGATAGTGTSGLQTGMQGSGSSATGAIAVRDAATPADAASGTGTANTPAKAAAAANNSADPLIKQHLAEGVPAAILADGKAYILAIDSRQLAQYAGQTVRADGQSSSGNTFIPTKLEVANTDGTFRAISLNTAPPTPVRSANERE